MSNDRYERQQDAVDKAVGIGTILTILFITFGLVGFPIAVILSNWMEPAEALLVVAGGAFVVGYVMHITDTPDDKE